ncbi:MAG TPA: NAD(P)H-hydrate dehydratase [bacterium]|nr:NAD(P)H-hydrate dehydratase [bacterium]
MKKITKDIFKKIYKKRSIKEETHKYDYGLLLVIGGGQFYSGAPALSAISALRSGADMVHVIAPKRAADIIASFQPNLAAYPLKGDILTKEHLSNLINFAKNAEIVSSEKTAIVIGGGMGRSKQTQEVILEFLSKINVPVVIDADAIHAIAKNPKVISEKNFLITPHINEFFILTGKKVKDLNTKERIKKVKAAASELRTTILLKGKIDIISNGKEVVLNEAGSPYMSVGGTGDTLAGICGSFMARGINPFLSAQAGAYINGKAGEIAGNIKKEGLLATDVIEIIPEILN